MDDRQFLVLLALNAYRDKEGVIFTTHKLLQKCGYKEGSIRTKLRELEALNLIENKTVDGYSLQFKCFKPQNCPDFIFSETLTLDDKLFILRLLRENISDFSSHKGLDKQLNSKNIHFTLNRIEKKLNMSMADYLKTIKCIKLSLKDSEEYEFFENKGYQIKQDFTNKIYFCQYCGENKPSNFYKNSSITCKKCQNKRAYKKSKEDIPNKLIQSSKAGVTKRSKIKEYSITKEDIANQIALQNNKCYYTNIEFDNENYPSIDRIDSNKGYTKENIVICLQEINIMKNDLSLADFKNFISLIYKNINNI